MKKLQWLLLGTILLVCGCASVGNNYDESRVSRIEKGVTTEDDLVKLFGPPNSHSINSNGTKVLGWTYYESEVKGESFIPYAGAFMGGANSAQKSLSVTLGSSGRVIDYTETGGTMESRDNQLGTPGGTSH